MIHRNTITFQTTPQYSSEEPITYVIEVNAGFSEDNNIRKGDYINVQKLLESGNSFEY
jgi:uncharacterized membrane protein (UPF0127 family)